MDVFNIDVSHLSEDELRLVYIESILPNFISFQDEIIRNQRFVIHTNRVNVLAKQSIDVMQSYPNWCGESYDEIVKQCQEVLDNDDAYIRELNRKVYVDYYQILEIFMARCFDILYWVFPRTLLGGPEQRVLSGVVFDDQFRICV